MSKKCKACHFDPDNDSLVANGSPCGVDGCRCYTCCNKAWQDHCKRKHPEYYTENFGGRATVYKRMIQFMSKFWGRGM